MKALGKIVVSVFMVLFLVVGLSHAQDTVAMTYKRGLKYGVQGDFSAAKRTLEKVLAVRPSNMVVAEILKVIQDFDDKKLKADGAVFFFKGMNFLNKDLWEEAIVAFSKAIERNPGFVAAYHNRGVAYYEKGQDDRAFADYNKAIKMDPEYPWTYINRGLAYRKKGQHDKAMSDFTRAIEINPRYEWAYRRRGHA